MDIVDVDGLRIAFTRAGRGPSLVFLGGFVGSGPATWRHQLAALSGTHTVVAWDAPGSGESSDVPESYRLPDYSDRLAALVSALGLDPPIIVGLSFGGALALRALRSAPRAGAWPVSRRRICRVGGIYDAGDGRVATTHQHRSVAAGACGVRVHHAAEHVLGHRARTHCRFVRRRHRVELSPRRVPCDGAGIRRGRPARRPAHDRRAHRDSVRRSRSPAPRPVAEALRAAIPGSRLVVLAGVGHVSCLEAPERFTAELRAFVELRG